MSRHVWRQDSSPAPRWAWPCTAAARGRRLRGRAAAYAGVALYRERQRVYTRQVEKHAHLPWCQRLGAPEGAVVARKSSFENTSEGDEQEKRLSIGFYGGKSSAYTVVRV